MYMVYGADKQHHVFSSKQQRPTLETRSVYPPKPLQQFPPSLFLPGLLLFLPFPTFIWDPF